MIPIRRHALALGLTALLTGFAPGCNRGEAPVQSMQQKAAEAEVADAQLRKTEAEQAQKLGQAGIPAEAAALSLTMEQKQALEQRVRSEKGTSTAALLQEILDKDKEIKDLNARITKLRAELPKPEIAKAEDNHYGLAMGFLRRHGYGEEQARRLVSQVSLMEQLEPGFEVYHFLANGHYGTWVAKGKARIAPTELARQMREKIVGERDEARTRSEALKTELGALAEQKQNLESDIAALRGERVTLAQQVAELNTLTARQQARLTSLHYRIGEVGQLEREGLITVPFFAKDRLGPQAKDSSFDRDLPLKAEGGPEEIVIKASDCGLGQIRKVHVVPGSLVKDEHYTLSLSGDGATATVRILKPERFLNDKVVFAVSGSGRPSTSVAVAANPQGRP